MCRKKILIFGSTGETGVYVTDFLNRKMKDQYEIIAIGRRKTDYFNERNISYFSVDITDPNDFKQLSQENVFAIVHLAAVLPARIGIKSPQKYFEINTIGTLNILEYAKTAGVDRILFMKSVSDYYGYLTGDDIFPANLPPKLKYTGDHTIYAISKCAADDVIEHYSQMYGIKKFTLRLPNIYCYHPDKYYYVDDKKVPISYRYMIDRAIQGKPIELWGDPKKGRDVVYVKDFAQIIWKALLSESMGGTFNVGSGKKTSMLEQIQGMIDVFSQKDNPSKIIYCPEKRDCINYLMDISKTEKELGYTPQYDYTGYLMDYKKEMLSNRFEGL